jgi:hypothetical protein
VFLSDGDYFTGTEGRYIINLEDVAAMEYVRDVRRFAGCCGVSGIDGPTHVCPCSTEVGTMKADCWMPHCLIFELNTVDLVE